MMEVSELIKEADALIKSLINAPAWEQEEIIITS